MPKAYLTIDDSPSERTCDLVDFLKEREIPALLYVCGNWLEQNPKPIEYAIQNGFIIANHSFAHQPAGDIEPQDWADDLEKCDHLIEAAYARCSVDRPFKAYRFPYVDRGDGNRLERNVAEGKGLSLSVNDRVKIMQNYLHEQGFIQPFKSTSPDYPNDIADSLFSFTSCDWMLTERHKGRWEHKTLDDLKARIDQQITDNQYHHVTLFHDQAEIFDEFCALIDYLLKKDVTFLDF